MKKILWITVAILCASSPANAGSAGGPPINIMFAYNSVVFFDVITNRSGAPACATMPTRFAVATNTDSGKAFVTAILTAQARGKTISVSGLGTCSTWADSEDVGLLLLDN